MPGLVGADDKAYRFARATLWAKTCENPDQNIYRRHTIAVQRRLKLIEMVSDDCIRGARMTEAQT